MVVVGKIEPKVWGVVRNMPEVEFVVVAGSWDGVERLGNVSLVDVAPEGVAVLDPSVWGDDPAGWLEAARAQMKGVGRDGEGEAGKRRRRGAVEVPGDAGARREAGAGDR